MSAGEAEHPEAISKEQEAGGSVSSSADHGERDLEDEQQQQQQQQQQQESSSPETGDSANPDSSPPETSATAKITKPTTTVAPWANVGKVAPNQSSSPSSNEPSKSFADIMAEQNEDLAAAQAAYGDSDAALVDMEKEQERAFQEMVANKLQQTPEPLILNPEEMTEEEMLAMVMQQSLAEYEEQNAGASTTATDPTILDNVIPEEEPSKDLSPKLLPRSLSPHSDHRRTPAPARTRPLLGDKEFSERHLKAVERTAIEIDTPHVEVESPFPRLARSSSSVTRGGERRRPPPPSFRRTKSAIEVTVPDPLERPSLACRRAMMMESASKHLSMREIHEIDQALREAEEEEVKQRETSPHNSSHQSTSRSRRSSFSTSPRANSSSVALQAADSSYLDLPAIQSPVRGKPNSMAISEEEAASIEAALREADAIEAALQEADAKAEMESMMLAQQMQIEAFIEANSGQQSQPSSQQPQGNVRSMTRAQLEYESERVSNAYQGNMPRGIGAMHAAHPPPLHPLEVEPALREMFATPPPPSRQPVDDEPEFEEEAGFRMNSASRSQWARRDRNTIVGPNGEVRSKHDVHLQGQANAHILGLDPDDFGVRTHVGNKAFNSFKKNMKRTTKGVARDGTGRAGSDTDATKGKAMDPHVRLQISRAINAGLIDRCNGVVKQGKEAMVYHANEGENSEGFDVAVKVFKRIQEFRGRADYVEGDPRYVGRAFRKASEREQLEMWTEKEFRNLVRANRAKVPVPTPLHYKENILFMRFMGNNGWPAPQIREVEIRIGSKKWELLYSQVMESIRRLYKGARLIHGDLSEYNILIAPVYLVENPVSSVEDTVNELQAVFIDFGQAVDVRHPDATALLLRDLDRVRTFFVNKGVQTLSVEESHELVTEDLVDDESCGESVPSAADTISA